MTKHQKTENLKPEKTENALAPETLAQLDADVAALTAEACELTDDVRVGDDLRFKKGKWVKTIGKTDAVVGSTTSFAIDMRSYKRGWIKWLDRKPVFKAIRRPIDGFVSPPRSQLPDRDKSRWPTDPHGAPQDPWQENFLIAMRDLDDGRLCTWTTTSWYGSKALGALLKVYTREVKAHPGLMPVVLLSSETKETVDYGDVEAPVLTVVDWQPFGPDAAPPGTPLPQPEFPKAQELLPPPSKPIGDDMNDEVAF